MAVERASPSALAHFDPADLLDALSTGIVMLDAQLCPVYANVAAQDLLAFSLNTARGRPFADFLHDANGLARILKRALETGEGIADRELAVRPVGAPRELRTLDVTITPLTGLTGTYLLLELADTTQRQRITRENDLLARLDGSGRRRRDRARLRPEPAECDARPAPAHPGPPQRGAQRTPGAGRSRAHRAADARALERQHRLGAAPTGGERAGRGRRPRRAAAP